MVYLSADDWPVVFCVFENNEDSLLYPDFDDPFVLGRKMTLLSSFNDLWHFTSPPNRIYKAYLSNICLSAKGHPPYRLHTPYAFKTFPAKMAMSVGSFSTFLYC